MTFLQSASLLNLHLLFNQPITQSGQLSDNTLAVIDALDNMLKGAQLHFKQQDLPQWWCDYFGVKLRPEQLPLAMLTVAEELTPEMLLRYPHWLLAQPLHLALQRDTFQLDLIKLLSREDAERLLATLNQHFAQDGLIVLQGKSGQWFVGMSQALSISALLPEQVHGKLLNHVLPTGEDAGKWRRISNEIQMLLFDHPVNQAREASGLRPVSGVWLYGGAPLNSHDIASADSQLPTIWAESLLVNALAKLTHRAHCWQHICHLTALADVLAGNQPCIAVYEGLDALTIPQVDALRSALRSGALNELRITLNVGDALLQYQSTRWDIFKFWRKNHPLKETLAARGWL